MAFGILFAHEARHTARSARPIQEKHMKLVTIVLPSLFLLASACAGSQEEPKSPAEQKVDDAKAEVDEAVEEVEDEVDDHTDDK
jgi:hypothetical protein